MRQTTDHSHIDLASVLRLGEHVAFTGPGGHARVEHVAGGRLAAIVREPAVALDDVRLQPLSRSVHQDYPARVPANDPPLAIPLGPIVDLCFPVGWVAVHQ